MSWPFATIFGYALALSEAECPAGRCSAPPVRAGRTPVACSSLLPEGLADGDDQVTAVHCNGRDGFFVPSLRYRDLSNADELVEDLGTEVALLNQQVVELTGERDELVKSASASASRADLAEEILDRLERPWYDHPFVQIGVAMLTAFAVVLIAD